ncbi:hypothetical protein ACHWQZ_G016797 [Mnemiopsis leidyi]
MLLMFPNFRKLYESWMTTPVTLYVYDLSNGLAKTISPFILGRRIEGLWHTAIVVYGNEYFFGGHGIACCVPGTTQLGPPLKQELLGMTAVTQDIFEDYLVGHSNSKFHGSSYHLLENNCNNFSDEVAKFLVGSGIDKEIVSLPQRVLSSPLGPLLKGHLEKMSNVAPTDSRNLTQSTNTSLNANGNCSHSRGQGSNAAVNSWEGSTSLYFPCFSPIQLTDEELASLKQVDTALPTAVQRGPLSTEDLTLICRVHTSDKLLFIRTTALLAHKSGFIRLALADSVLYKMIKESCEGDDQNSELNVASEILSNNFLAGMNQIDRTEEELISTVTARIAKKSLVDATVTSARLVYNLSGSQLTEDQILEIGGALIFSLPDTADTVNNDNIDTVTTLDLLLKSLYLLMIKSRQVADLCSAMDKDVSVFRDVPQLLGIVGKILEIQKSS